MKSTTVIFADELISIVDQDLDASEELDQLRKAVYAYRYATTPRPTEQAQRRIANSARWMYLAGQHDPDLLTRNLVELWGIEEGDARTYATAAISAAPKTINTRLLDALEAIEKKATWQMGTPNNWITAACRAAIAEAKGQTQ